MSKVYGIFGIPRFKESLGCPRFNKSLGCPRFKAL